VTSILYIFLPCKQIYPVGCTYLADYIHKRHPEVRQRILDLSQIPPGERAKAVRETAENVRPDLVCFSWRDIQIFSPHEGDASLEQAFTFYYSNNPFKKIAASLSGLKSLYQYYSGIRANLAHAWLIRKTCPDAQIVMGGGAFGAFAEQLIEKLPEGTIGILGEGEEAVLKMVEGKPLDGERFIARQNGKTITGTGQSYTGLDDLSVDLPYIAEIFPQYTAYTDDCIGVQSKRGCPYDCAFCLYPYLEGKSVRYRPAALVVKDIAQHYRQWGTRRFWFTDAQFITGKAAYPQCTEIMERIIAERLEIEWSGYIRTSLITSEFAKLMVRSGVGDLEVAITSGSQEVLNGLHMGFVLVRLYDGCRYLAAARLHRVLQAGRGHPGRGPRFSDDVFPGHPAAHRSRGTAAGGRVSLGGLQPADAEPVQHPETAVQPRPTQQADRQGLSGRLESEEGAPHRQPRSQALVRCSVRLLSSLGRKGQLLCRLEPPPRGGIELRTGRVADPGRDSQLT